MIQLVVLFYFISCGFSWLEDVTSAEIQQQLVSNILASQDEKTGLFQSLSATHHTVQYFSDKGESIPWASVLCTHLKPVSAKNWEEFQFLLATRARLPNCLKIVPDQTRDKLISGFSAKKLSSLFYAVNAQSILVAENKMQWEQSNLNQAAQQVLKFKSSDGMFGETSKTPSSAHKTALALKTIARILSADGSKNVKVLPELIQAANTAALALTSKSEKKGGVIVFQNSLTVTSTVVESIFDYVLALKNNGKTLDLSQTWTPDFVDGVANFFLNAQNTVGAGASRQVLSALNILSSSDVFPSKPISFQCQNFVQLLDGSSPKFSVLLTTLDGSQYPFGSQTVSMKFSGVKVGDSTQTFASAVMNSKDGKRYVGDVVRAVGDDSNNALGVWDVEISTQIGGETIRFNRQVKIVTKLGKATLKYGFMGKSDDSDGQGKGTTTLKQGEKFKNTVEISPTNKVKLEISLDSSIRPFQALVEFRKQNRRYEFPLTWKKNAFHLSMNLNKKQFMRVEGGEYELLIVVGDSRLANGLNWNVGEIQVTPAEVNDQKDYEPVNDETPRYQPKEEISWTFQKKNPRPYSIFPTVFLVGTCVWLVAFAGFVLLYEGISISLGIDGKATIASLVFVGSLGLIVTILIRYFLEYNIFEAGFRLAGCGVVSFVAGYNVLKQHVLYRTGGHKKHE